MYRKRSVERLFFERLVLLGLLNVLHLCAPNSPPKSARIEQAADGMRSDHRSLGHPKGWTGLGPPKSMLATSTDILQGPMRTHTSYLKREKKQPGRGSSR
jgi:hypothetical protein